MLSEHTVDHLRLILRGLRYRDGGLRFLAQRAGVSYSWLTKFSTGRTRNEKIESLRRISRVLPLGAWQSVPSPITTPQRVAEPLHPAKVETSACDLAQHIVQR